MQHDVKSRLVLSSRAFAEYVWPRLTRVVGTGRLCVIEDATSRDHPNIKLDTLAGIDAWQEDVDGVRLRGIASRVQWIHDNHNPYNTFTIRWSLRSNILTEIDKRMIALTSNGEWVFPWLTIQAYLTCINGVTNCNGLHNTGQLICAGVVKTRDLYEWISKNHNSARQITNVDGRSTFKAFKWRDLVNDGIRVRVVDGAGRELVTV